MIHYGKPGNSGRLRATARLMRRKCGATGAEIQALTGSTCVHTDVAELRQFYRTFGMYEVLPAEYAGRSKAGRKIYRYRIIYTGE